MLDSNDHNFGGGGNSDGPHQNLEPAIAVMQDTFLMVKELLNPCPRCFAMSMAINVFNNQFKHLKDDDEFDFVLTSFEAIVKKLREEHKMKIGKKQ